MKSLKQISTFFLISLFLVACGSKDEEKTIQRSSSLACSTSATVSSGNISGSYASVTLANLTVSIYNGAGGSYRIGLPNGQTVSTSSSSYVHPSTFSMTTGYAGGINSSISVTDQSNGDSASCSLIISGSPTGSSVVVLNASPSTTAVKGSYITMTATAPSVTSPVFSFAVSATNPGYVTITNSSNGVALVSSSIAQTVLVTATMTSNASGAMTAYQTTTLTFTDSGTSTGTVSVAFSASPSTSVAVGAQIVLTATVTGISDPLYSYYFVGNNSLNASASYSGNLLYVSSTVAGSVTLGVTATSASNSNLKGSTQVTLTFGGTGTSYPTNLSCTLFHVGSYFSRGQSVPFYITSGTGEPLRLVAWEPGEPWDYAPPSFPINLSGSGSYQFFYGTYQYTGTKSVRVIAESITRPGTYCNGGQYLTDSVSIY